MIGAKLLRPHLTYVDGLRALAALGVLWTHGIGCAERMCAGAHPAWRDIGDRGVELFFVISGFCLAYPFFARKRSGRPLNLDYVRFLIRRFARIAPPYYICLGILGLVALTPLGFPGNASLGTDAAGARRDHVRPRPVLRYLGLAAVQLVVLDAGRRDALVSRLPACSSRCTCARPRRFS
jgi:peptidoglycan/LPS O-acetylase OafA/YrhL